MLWLQELVTLANKAKGKAGTKMDIVDSYLGSSSLEDLPITKATDQEENLLQQFLSPKVCQPPSLQEATFCYTARSGQLAMILQQQNMLGMPQCGLHDMHWSSDPLFERSSVQSMTHLDSVERSAPKSLHHAMLVVERGGTSPT